MLTNFSYIRPKSLKEAMKQLSVPGARLHAGGTDLLGCLRDHVFDAKTVVSISGIRDFRGVKKTTGGGLSIGALTTVADVAASSLVKESYPALVKAALSVASPQLRNQGTIGGNICQKPRCWYYRGEFLCLRKGGKKCFAAGGENQYHCILGGGPCYIVHPSDVATALVAYEAMLHITGPKGSRVVPVEKFHVLPKVDVHRETVLEAGDYFCVASLPATLLVDVAAFLQEPGPERVPVSVEAQSGALPARPENVSRLKARGIDCRVLFLEAGAQTLLGRFSETRRRHPLTVAGLSLAEAIERERSLLASVADLGHRIDTSELLPRALRSWIKEVVGLGEGALTLMFESFAFRDGIPLEVNAYVLGRQFAAHLSQPFSVADEVARWVREERF